MFLPFTVQAQNIYTPGTYQFTAYEKIPAWACVASGWETPNASIHLYDYEKYKGHANFVSFGLKTGISFAQFKEQVKHYASRKYLPFFIYDLRKNPLKKNRQSYTWVIRLEDYAYDDSPAQMAETAIRLYNSVETYINKETGKQTKGLLILAVSEKVQPNIRIKNSIENSGVSTLLLKELINHAGAVKTIVLNTGTAYGTLRYVKASENETARLDKNDVVIFEKAPLRIPPVAGIITLEPQTPLSHVNLLAKNRGTINISTDKISSIPNLEKALGQPVKIVCDKKNIAVSMLTKKELDSWLENQPPVSLQLPSVFLSPKNIVDLDTDTKQDVSLNCIGAKAANFHVIRNAFPSYVGKGFAIPFSFYYDHLRKCKAKNTIDSLINPALTLSSSETQKLLEQMRSRILSVALDTLLLKQVRRIQQTAFGGRKIRLRSSTNCEDLPGFNGAGLYLSHGYEKAEGKKKLEQKIKEIFASMWTVHAYDERAFYHINHADAYMAILINEAFENEKANGVVLTIPGENNVSVYINAQPGSHLVTNPKSDEIPKAIFFNSASDTVYEVRMHSSFGDVFLLKENESFLVELKELSANIHKLLTETKTKYGTDIEFKLVEECGSKKLIVKQARLIYDASPY